MVQLFFCNEFFDAIPIKQFKRYDDLIYEKYFEINKENKICEKFKKLLKKILTQLKLLNRLKNLIL